MVSGQYQTGSISGKLTDSDGNPLPGVTVSVKSDQTTSRRTVITDGKGEFRAGGLMPGRNYSVTSTLDGFNRNTQEGIEVKASRDTEIGGRMSLAEVQEELIVTAEAPTVELTNSGAGDLTLQLVESLPTARNFQDYINLVPGLQGGVAPAEANPRGPAPGNATPGGDQTDEGVFLREFGDNGESLIIDLRLPNGDTIDRIEIRGDWKTDFSTGYGPADWTFEQDGKEVNVAGPERERVRLRFDTSFTGKDRLRTRLENKKVKVEASRQGKAVYRAELPVTIAPNVRIDYDIGSAINFPYQVRTGEWFMISTSLDTFRNGYWDIGIDGSIGAASGGEFSPPTTIRGFDRTYFLVAPPRDLTPGDRLRLNFTDVWNQRLLDDVADETEVVEGGGDSCPTSLDGSTPRVFVGRPLCTCGCFNDPKSWFSLAMDQSPIAPAAATSSMIIVNIPEGTAPGDHTIKWTAGFGQPTQQVTFVVLAVIGSIDQNKLWTGQSTTLRFQILGTREKLPIEITNETPEIITVEGGTKQVITTSGGEENTLTREVRGTKRGNFSITYKLDESPCPCLPGNGDK